MDNIRHVFEALNSRFKLHVIECDETNAVLRSSIKTKEHAETFVTEFAKATLTRWIILTKLKSPERIIFHQKWICHHSNIGKSPASQRNANCEAYIDIKIKKINKDTRYKDPYLKKDPPLCGIIKLDLRHTHNIGTPDSLRQFRVPLEIENQFFSYFSNGMTPADSRRFHESLLLSNEDESYAAFADSSKNPTARQVFNIYQKWKDLNLGCIADPFVKLQEKLELYTKSGTSVMYQKDHPWSVLIVTPVMKRAHNIPSSKEMIFLDSTASCDLTTVTVLLTASKAGAIPIAVLMHEQQDTNSYIKAFCLLKENFPLCFGKDNEPKVFITEDSQSEKSALKSVWPSATQLLCHFYVALAEWRWLWANCHPKEHRPTLMRLFQKVMYSRTTVELDLAVRNLREESGKYPEFVKRFEVFFKRKEEWVLLFRNSIVTRNHNTNNYSEAMMRIIKDVVIQRVKALNVVALTEYCISGWDSYLVSRLLAIANNRDNQPEILYQNMCRKLGTLKGEEISNLGQNMFSVKSGTKSDKTYTVNTDIGVCTCPAGMSGAFCKHQCLLYTAKKIQLPSMPAVTSNERYRLGTIALGEKCPQKSFFSDLKDHANEMEPLVYENKISTSISYESSAHQTYATEQDKAEFSTAVQMCLQLCDGTVPKTQLKRLTTELNKLKSSTDLVRAIQTTGLALSSTSDGRKAKGRISICRRQPTNFARRKRKRSLNESIKQNCPNAK